MLSARMRLVARLVTTTWLARCSALLLPLFQFDFARVRKSRLQEQRMVNEGNDAAFELGENSVRKGAERQAVNDKHGIGGFCLEEPACLGEVSGGGIWKRAGQRQHRDGHAEIGQNFHHAAVIGIAAGRALQISGNGEEGISHGWVPRSWRGQDRFPKA